METIKTIGKELKMFLERTNTRFSRKRIENTLERRIGERKRRRKGIVTKIRINSRKKIVFGHRDFI